MGVWLWCGVCVAWVLCGGGVCGVTAVWRWRAAVLVLCVEWAGRCVVVVCVVSGWCCCVCGGAVGRWVGGCGGWVLVRWQWCVEAEVGWQCVWRVAVLCMLADGRVGVMRGG